VFGNRTRRGGQFGEFDLKLAVRAKPDALADVAPADIPEAEYVSQMLLRDWWQ